MIDIVPAHYFQGSSQGFPPGLRAALSRRAGSAFCRELNPHLEPLYCALGSNPEVSECNCASPGETQSCAVGELSDTVIGFGLNTLVGHLRRIALHNVPCSMCSSPARGPVKSPPRSLAPDCFQCRGCRFLCNGPAVIRGAGRRWGSRASRLTGLGG